MLVTDLGLMPYRDAWARQEQAHARVLEGGEEEIFVVEHPPVITFGRRPGVDANLKASPEQLQHRGVEVVQSDRGGDITFHGPGQIVVYPIVRLAGHKLSVSGYVHRLEAAVVDALAELGIAAKPDPQAVGVWVDDGGVTAKVCAIGVRIRRGVSLHGLALNVETDLTYFDLIVPCGLVGRPVTSLRKLLGGETPPMVDAKRLVSSRVIGSLG